MRAREASKEESKTTCISGETSQTKKEVKGTLQLPKLCRHIYIGLLLYICAHICCLRAYIAISAIWLYVYFHPLPVQGIIFGLFKLGVVKVASIKYKQVFKSVSNMNTAAAAGPTHYTASSSSTSTANTTQWCCKIL